MAVVNSIYSFWWDVTNDWGLDLFKLESPSKMAHEKRLPRRLVLPHLHSATPLMRRDSQETLVEEPLRILPLEDPPKHRRTHPFGLRPVLLFPLPVYPLLIFLNLVLRMTWSIKLSSHLHTSEGSVASLWLEVAELIRRWLWVFLRVEWEVIRKAQGGDPKIRYDDDGLEYEMAHDTPEVISQSDL